MTDNTVQMFYLFRIPCGFWVVPCRCIKGGSLVLLANFEGTEYAPQRRE